ncbi:hypothetical protein [Salmonirosea aquatica]|uniref:Uncharacterized protein n=1 Tax=Salmonirosea aquatica TaxID=2654236 RepID=A0A7C9BF66_9BACT|nr:hypothetical protein [Cytophagaceae bacterium SJW1-29]
MIVFKNYIGVFFIIITTVLTVNAQLQIGEKTVGINTEPPNLIKLSVKGENGNQLMLDNSGEQYNALVFAKYATPQVEFKMDNNFNIFYINSLQRDLSFMLKTLSSDGTEKQQISITPTSLRFGGGALTVVNGEVRMSGGVTFGGIGAGNIRWAGSDLQVHNGQEWVSLLNKPVVSYWAAVTADGNCNNVCQPGYTNAPDANGKVCKDISGSTFTGVTYDRFQWIVTSTSITYKDFWGCGSSTIETQLKKRLGQCHCVKIN